MKIIYQAEDGRQFDTEAECLVYERDADLRNLIRANIGSSPFELEDVVKFFTKHFDEISAIVKPTGVKSCSFDDEWISNIGHDACWRPETLSNDTEIEVKFRDGETAIGYAGRWDASWKETDGHPRDIVAYRIIK